MAVGYRSWTAPRRRRQRPTHHPRPPSRQRRAPHPRPPRPGGAGGRAGPPPGAAEPAVAAEGEAWEEEKAPAGHWREDKVGLLLTMKSAVSVTDPCPEIPPSFLDAARIPELVRELSRRVKA